MTSTLQHKVALVTGAGSGIGRACALVMAREGATVVVSDIDADGAEETLDALKQAGGDGMVVLADVTRDTDVAALVRETVATYGRLDCACNNAGIVKLFGERIDQLPEDEWDHIITLNMKGVWLCLKHETAQMLRQGGGSIVNMASAAGLIAVPGGSAYVASKHGVVGLTKAAALEYALDGIRVNAVCPGVIDTARRLRRIKLLRGNLPEVGIPMGRLGTRDEVAECVAWLCSDAASLVTGLAMAADGGYTAQ